MARMACTFLTSLLAIAATSTAMADPIRVTVSRSSLPWNQDTFLLSDNFAADGGQITPGVASFLRSQLPPYAYGPDGQQVAFHELLQQFFGALLTFDHATAGPPAADSPAVWISANLQGELFDDNPTDSNLSGDVHGADLFAEKWQTSSSDSPDIPADLRSVMDAFLDTGRLSISGHVQGGRDNIMPIVLTVSPAPVPEPTTWAAWTLLGATGWTIRHQGRSRAAARRGPSTGSPDVSG